jgi:hypothetical protein
LLVAGAVAGLVGTAGGITSLISYPVLLAVGVPPLRANVSNIVAYVACWPGSALASRPELRDRGPLIAKWGAVTAAGGIAGSALLLTTSANVFVHIVPFLVALGALTLMFQPWLTDRHRSRDKRSTLLLPAGLFALGVYSGYYGAGSGVMALALLMITVDDHLARANALKNMIIGGTATISAIVLVIFGPVEWSAVLPLGAGMFIGATLGPVVARRLPARPLRWVVSLIGLGLAVVLWVRGGNL